MSVDLCRSIEIYVQCAPTWQVSLCVLWFLCWKPSFRWKIMVDFAGRFTYIGGKWLTFGGSSMQSQERKTAHLQRKKHRYHFDVHTGPFIRFTLCHQSPQQKSTPQQCIQATSALCAISNLDRSKASALCLRLQQHHMGASRDKHLQHLAAKLIITPQNHRLLYTNTDIGYCTV